MICPHSLVALLLIVGFDVVSAFRLAAAGRFRESGEANLKPVLSPVATSTDATPAEVTAKASSFVATKGRTALAVGLEAEAGHLLGQRFVLERFIESRSSTKQPGEVFPDIEGFTDTKHLGQGAFGDVWEAYDEQLKKRVAVKIFYSKGWFGQKKWLTWNSANAKEKADLEESVEECVLVQNMLKQSSLYPQGASRICECYEEHVSKYENTDELTFLVLEMCGRTLEDIGDDLEKLDGSTRIAKSRQLTKQLLEAIAFMNMLDPPLIHHDLKLDNAVALEESGFNVKLIDFGCFVWGTPENQNTQSSGAHQYLAPEYSNRQPYVAFKLPAYSFDIYSVGLMHMMLSCPNVGVRDWGSSWYPSWAWAEEHCAGLPTADIEFIQALTNSDNTQRPAPWVALEDEVFQLEALNNDNDGCNTLLTEDSCIVAQDGRSASWASGQACQWCCGDACTGNGAKCEPKQWLLSRSDYLGHAKNGLGENTCPVKPLD